MSNEQFSRDRIEKAARIYNSNQDAGAALGIKPGSFGRLCRRYGIETPHVRRQREAATRKEYRREQENA